METSVDAIAHRKFTGEVRRTKTSMLSPLDVFNEVAIEFQISSII